MRCRKFGASITWPDVRQRGHSLYRRRAVFRTSQSELQESEHLSDIALGEIEVTGQIDGRSACGRRARRALTIGAFNGHLCLASAARVKGEQSGASVRVELMGVRIETLYDAWHDIAVQVIKHRTCAANLLECVGGEDVFL